jgi:hypothetical protein
VAISSGSMNRIIGPTRPTLSTPLASLPKPPIPSTGVKPFSIKNAVIKPQAMNAAMFGMIIPDRKVPNFCTATRALPALLVLGAPASAFTAMLCLRAGRRARPTTCIAPHSVATGRLPRPWYFCRHLRSRNEEPDK